MALKRYCQNLEIGQKLLAEPKFTCAAFMLRNMIKNSLVLIKLVEALLSSNHWHNVLNLDDFGELEIIFASL